MYWPILQSSVTSMTGLLYVVTWKSVPERRRQGLEERLGDAPHRVLRGVHHLHERHAGGAGGRQVPGEGDRGENRGERSKANRGRTGKGSESDNDPIYVTIVLLKLRIMA